MLDCADLCTVTSINEENSKYMSFAFFRLVEDVHEIEMQSVVLF